MSDLKDHELDKFAEVSILFKRCLNEATLEDSPKWLKNLLSYFLSEFFPPINYLKLKKEKSFFEIGMFFGSYIIGVETYRNQLIEQKADGFRDRQYKMIFQGIASKDSDIQINTEWKSFVPIMDEILTKTFNGVGDALKSENIIDQKIELLKGISEGLKKKEPYENIDYRLGGKFLLMFDIGANWRSVEQFESLKELFDYTMAKHDIKGITFDTFRKYCNSIHLRLKNPGRPRKKSAK